MIETPAEILSHHATKEAADSFVAWRKRTKKPLTETAALRIAKTLAAINAAGGDARDCLPVGTSPAVKAAGVFSGDRA